MIDSSFGESLFTGASVLPPLQGGVLFLSYLGLKPQAQSLSPFGTKARTPVHIFDSASSHPFEDSLPDVAPEFQTIGRSWEDDDEYEDE